MKKKEKPFALVLAVLALLLAAYATYATIGLQSEHKAENFKASVFGLIDDYIAEKSGQPTGPVDVSVDDDAAKGEEDAPVTIVEFTDYQCPFCKRFADEALPQIMKDYVDTGKVRLVVRDFPLTNHPNAATAANAAECLREQGGDEMYFGYHDALFENQTDLSTEKLKEYAAGFDIDQAQFASCVDENKYQDEVAADFKAGTEYGVRGTPAFFINGNLFAGAQPYENFKAAIEAALTEAE
jgi:protein-disulfide isomerase